MEIYSRTPILECDLSKVAKPLVLSGKFAAYFQNTFLQEHFQVTAAKPLKQLYHTLILGIYKESS